MTDTSDPRRYSSVAAEFLADTARFNSAIIAEFRQNGGQLGGEFAGGNFLILHTTGAKTGLERLTPVAYLRVPDDDRLYVVAAGPGEVGAPRHPDWFRNLVAHPDVTVEVGTEMFQARATVLNGSERAKVWDAVLVRIPHFASYDANPHRRVPIVALDPMTDAPGQGDRP